MVDFAIPMNLPRSSRRIALLERPLHRVCQLRDGSTGLWRPVSSADTGELEAMVLRQTPATRYARFHGVVNHLSDGQLAGLTRNGPLRLGLVLALEDRPALHRIVAEARFASDGGHDAEIALMVDEDHRREGLARTAIGLLAAAARRAGLRHLQGRVLDGNEAMLALARRAGWPLTRDPEDARVRCFRVALTDETASAFMRPLGEPLAVPEPASV